MKICLLLVYLFHSRPLRLIAGKLAEVYNALKSIPHLHTYYKEDVPREYHYTYNRRIQPIVILAEEGYDIVQNASEAAGQLHFHIVRQKAKTVAPQHTIDLEAPKCKY